MGHSSYSKRGESNNNEAGQRHR
jgi:hypothetical protein